MIVQVGVGSEFFFSGKVVGKGATDVIIVEYPDELAVPRILEYPGQIPSWNENIDGFVKLTIEFCLGYIMTVQYLNSIRMAIW